MGSVKLGGDLKVPQDQLEQLILVKPGQVFSRKVMTDTTNLITRRLGNDGYTFANVNGVPKPDEADHTVDISFVVDPGTPRPPMKCCVARCARWRAAGRRPT